MSDLGMARAGVEDVIRGRLLATVEELGPDAVPWLAVAPLWTLGAAEAAGFPVRPVVGFVRRACDVGWCRARGPLLEDAPPDLVFWMPGEVRRDAIDALRTRDGGMRIAREQERVAASVAAVAAQLMTRGGAGTDPPESIVPGALRAWADLLSSADPGTRLVTWTEQATASGDLGRAQDLVAAGEAIAGVLGGTTELALSRARRILTLGQRRRQDERVLDRYLDRRELSDAVARLLTGDETLDTPWALHLRGVGGAGKTMLIKYLALGRLAADRGLMSTVVRADFDYISPDYPVRRPVQLLLELADELALHTATSLRADQLLARFRTYAVRAHEMASALRDATGSALLSTEVGQAVDAFGDVLAELGDVLLVLDTCEEIAKADLGDTPGRAILFTLDVIERLHQRVPSVRVLFAGRRPLPVRPYLTVQPVAGFTVDEARSYLAGARGRPLSPDLADEIIRQSPAIDGPVPAKGLLPDRVSPFDLALYAAWAEDDPGLDVAEVRRGSDAYIEGRIIDRLGDPLVLRALPLLAVLGRCRVATLAEFLDCDPAVLGRRLAALEWIESDGYPVTHVAARPALASRLRRYFESDERRAGFAAQTAAVAASLLDRVRQATLAEIDADELFAVLRLTEPAEAAALWDSIARGAASQGRWTMMLQLTRRLLGEWEEEQWPTTGALRATVVAAHIAASRRSSGAFDASDPWETVRTWAGRHPDPAAQRRLLARAVLGLLPYAPDDASLWQAATDAFAPASDDRPATAFENAELAAAFADCVHRLLEAGNLRAAERLHRLPLGPAKRLATADPGIGAWTELGRARLRADNDPAAARQALERAENLAASSAEEPSSWPDWIPPDDLLARVRIECGLIAPPADLTVLDGWESYAAARLGTVDGERLASLCLRIRLRHGVVDAATAGQWEAADSYLAGRAPSCTAHDLVPPLFVSVAQAWFAAGDPERAMALLDRRRAEALGTRQDELTVRHADAATVAIVRRLRLMDRTSFLARLAGTQPGSDDSGSTALGDVRLLVRLAEAVIGYRMANLPVPSPLNVPAVWHAWWQSQAPGPLAVAELSSPSARPRWLPARTSVDVADLRADLVEVEQLALQLDSPGIRDALADWEALRGDWPEQPPPPPQSRSAEPHREVRAAMRMAALANEDYTLPPWVPSRLLGEMAFGEAELTALRLPATATRLFLIAAQAYKEADDPLGEFLARLSVLLAGPLPDGPADARPQQAARLADQARGALTRRMPSVAAALDAPPQDAGPWRHWTPASREDSGWAKTVREASAPGTVSPPGTGQSVPALLPETTPGSAAADESSWPGLAPDAVAPALRRGRWLAVVSFVLSVLACAAAVAGVAQLAATNDSVTGQASPRNGASLVPWIAALIIGLAAIAALVGWFVSKAMRLARGQGIGAVRLGTLLFEAGVYAGRGTNPGTETYSSTLQVSARPWRTAPPRARAGLWLLIPAVRLVRLFRSRRPGYYFRTDVASDGRTAPLRLQWTDPHPAVPKTWWLRGSGTGLGLVRMASSGSYFDKYMSEPWERMLSLSLSPDAPGRIEWIRLVHEGILPHVSPQLESMLVAPLAWTRALSQYYTQASWFYTGVGGVPVAGLLHVIGRAVATSAGPAMDVSDPYRLESHLEPAPLDVTELERPQSSMVILQAEPAQGDTVGVGPPDDQAEKLRLGAALAADGIPAVLLLPVLPAAIADELARIITEHAGLPLSTDAQLLLSRVRATVAPHVAPPVLDDIVLFLNVARYRS